MKILITGLNGFIGKSLRSLLTENHQLMSLSRNNNFDFLDKNIEIITGDFSRPNEWGEKVIKFSPDYCIHLAWEGLPDYSLEKCIINLNKNLLFLNFLGKIGIPNIIFTGSCYEYGNYKGKLEEDFLPKEPPIFGITKLTIYNYLESICKRNNINFKWARIFFSYGPNQRLNSLIPSIWSNLKSNKANPIKTPYSSNDFIYIDDVANAILKLLDHKIPSGIYNIGSGNLTSNGYIANLIYSYYKRDIPYPNIESEKLGGFYSDIRKIKKFTSWDLKTSIENGVLKTIKNLDEKYG